MEINCFEPIINKQSEVLILGSMPGIESIKAQMYYANSRNQFWEIIYTLFNKKLDGSYKEKCKFLLDNKIAIWDVLEYCYREGSLDSKIKNKLPNDFKSLLEKYSNIKYIFLNGKIAENLLK